jgi:N-methylhydantoinase A
MRADGTVHTPLDLDQAEAAARDLLADAVEALALCFLHSYRNPAHEAAAAARIRTRFPDVFLSVSSEIWPQQREYERALATVMNAHVGRVLQTYFADIERGVRALGVTCPVMTTKSNGGIMTARRAARVPVETLLSGPASGVIAAAALGRQAGCRDLIGFDMGGTSADVAVVTGGDVPTSTESAVGDFPVVLPAVAVHCIGAGGGSIAWVDAAGVLKVGPQSAGADPGPACYGRAGDQSTVTDAYVVLGIIDPDRFLGGSFRLDAGSARAAIGTLGRRLGLDERTTAASILRVATANMYAQFLPLMARYGVDSTDFAILAYGGAGPTHACLLAQEVGVRRVIVPPTPGAFCALGCLVADARADFVRTFYRGAARLPADELEGVFGALEAQARAWLDEEGLAFAETRFLRGAEMRYAGQSYEVAVWLDGARGEAKASLVAQFHERHRAVYGHSDPAAPVDFIDLRVQVVGAAAKPRLGTVRRQSRRGDAGPGRRRAGPRWPCTSGRRWPRDSASRCLASWSSTTRRSMSRPASPRGWTIITMCSPSGPDRLLKKARQFSPLPRERQRVGRWRARTISRCRRCGSGGAAAYPEYASLGPSRAALHLGLFEQPGKKRESQQPG